MDEQVLRMPPDEMRAKMIEMGDECSVHFWMPRRIEPVTFDGEKTHRAAPNWVSQRDEE